MSLVFVFLSVTLLLQFLKPYLTQPKEYVAIAVGSLLVGASLLGISMRILWAVWHASWLFPVAPSDRAQYVAGTLQGASGKLLVGDVDGEFATFLAASVNLSTICAAGILVLSVLVFFLAVHALREGASMVRRCALLHVAPIDSSSPAAPAADSATLLNMRNKVVVVR